MGPPRRAPDRRARRWSDAMWPRRRAPLPLGDRRAVTADDHVRREHALRGHLLDVALPARLDDALRAGEHRDEQHRRGERGGAPAVGREARAGQQPGGAETPQRPGERRRREPHQRPAEQADTGREQQTLEDREGDRPHPREHQRHRDAAAEAQQADDELQDAWEGMLDRCLAQRLGGARAPGTAGRREDRQLSDQDPAAECRDERDPRVARSEARRDGVVSGEDADDRVGERAPGEQAEATGHERDDQRLAGDQAPDLVRRGAERAQHRHLAPTLRDGQRERAGDNEQRDRARDPAHGPEDRDQRSRSAARGSAASAAAACSRSRAPAPRRGRSGAPHRDRAHPVGSARQARGGPVGEEQRRGTAHRPADAVDGLACGRGDAYPGAGPEARPVIDDDLAGTGRRSSRGQHVRRERGARPAVAVQRIGVQARAVRVPRTDREGHVADDAGNARDLGGAVDVRGVEPRTRDHRVGGGEAPGARRPERPGHQKTSAVGERDREPDRDERPRERAAMRAQRLPGDAQHVRPPVRSGAGRPARPSARSVRRRPGRRP